MKSELIKCMNEIDYTFDRLSRDRAPGLHKSAVRGGGFRIKGYDNIFNNPDFPNIDWMTTIISGNKMPIVKIPEQKSAITIMAVCDVSASMAFSGVEEKQKEIAKFILSLGISAYKIGDRFGLIAYGEKIRAFFEPRVSRNHSFEIAEWLWDAKFEDSNSNGLMKTIDYLPNKPVLVFWLSDFNTDCNLLNNFLAEASQLNDVIPVVFWDSAEFANIPDWGLTWIYDKEIDQNRPELFWPGRKKEFKNVFENRQAELKSLFKCFEIDPLFVVNKLETSKIAEFFFKRMA